jgi:hypothetical protein
VHHILQNIGAVEEPVQEDVVRRRLMLVVMIKLIEHEYPSNTERLTKPQLERLSKSAFGSDKQSSLDLLKHTIKAARRYAKIAAIYGDGINLLIPWTVASSRYLSEH